MTKSNAPRRRTCAQERTRCFAVRDLLTSVAVLILCALSAAGCASGPDRSAPPNPADPWAKSNRAVYNFNSDLDRAVIKDISDGYTRHVTQSVRTGIGNFFDNLSYLNVILNDHLQGHFAQGWRNTERMAINTTIGIVGVFDPASGYGRPRQKNDFGITLGRWGASSGPYLVLPLLGPSTVRDVPGIIVSRITNPMFWLDPPLEVSIPMDVTSFVDQRASLQTQMDLRDRAAIDPYTFTRDVYLRRRSSQIGKSSHMSDEDIYGEPAPTTAPVSPTTMPAATR